MKCESCGREMRSRRATAAKPYRYDLSGLKNVFLAGIDVFDCPSGDAEVPVIPRMGELHRVLADLLVRKPTLLTGDEIRFLRKHAGVSASELAAQIGTTASYLSRVETGHDRRARPGRPATLGPGADKLVRAIVTARIESDATREILFEKAPRVSRSKKARSVEQLNFRFKLDRDHWEKAA